MPRVSDDTAACNRVHRAATKRAVAEENWKAAIRAAVAGGVSLRRVGEAAGVSHVRVLQILRGE